MSYTDLYRQTYLDYSEEVEPPLVSADLLNLPLLSEMLSSIEDRKLWSTYSFATQFNRLLDEDVERRCNEWWDNQYGDIGYMDPVSLVAALREIGMTAEHHVLDEFIFGALLHDRGEDHKVNFEQFYLLCLTAIASQIGQGHTLM